MIEIFIYRMKVVLASEIVVITEMQIFALVARLSLEEQAEFVVKVDNTGDSLGF